ncbi:MAG: signal peptidase I [Bacilli bacterium]|nr:signal peptidase I [Bacilli bacterium]MBQ8901452.1 signal peptidase I [Bacilli bacterium]
MKFIKELIPYLVIILVVITIRTFIVTPIVVQGESMVPTLDGGEVMILKKYDTNYERFDIVVVNKSVEGDNLIKRVIGLPGETIRYRNNTLYINDKVLEDVYAYGDTGNFQEITLGEDEYFLMGDNRAISLDSRALGIIKKQEIEGTVGIVLFPFNKFGSVE